MNDYCFSILPMSDLNMYDFGARQYNPVLGRWDRVDLRYK